MLRRKLNLKEYFCILNYEYARWRTLWVDLGIDDQNSEIKMQMRVEINAVNESQRQCREWVSSSVLWIRVKVSAVNKSQGQCCEKESCAVRLWMSLSASASYERQ